VGKAVEMATLVVLATVVPRVLGPSDYGRFALVLTIVTLGSLALTLGGPALVTRFVPAAPPDDQVPLARAFGRRLARESGVQLAALTAIAALVAVGLGVRISWPETIAVGAGLFLHVVATIGLLVVLGLGGAAAWSARYPIQNAVLIALVFVLHPIAGSAGALAAIPISAAAAVVFTAVVCAPVLTRREGPSPALPEGAARFGRFHAGGAALAQVPHRGGVVVVALVAGSTVETGFAALGVGIAIGLTYAIVQIFTVALPSVLASEDDPERGLTRIAEGVLAVVAPVCLITALLLDRLVPAVFGPEYAGASSAFGPALAVVVLAPLTALAGNVASVRLRPEIVTAASAASVVAFAAVALVAVGREGATGATAATLTGVVIGAGVSLLMLGRGVPTRLAVLSFGAAALVVAVAAVA
jgi:O-antigen/teichoic acid export membrane protein